MTINDCSTSDRKDLVSLVRLGETLGRTDSGLFERTLLSLHHRLYPFLAKGPDQKCVHSKQRFCALQGSCLGLHRSLFVQSLSFSLRTAGSTCLHGASFQCALPRVCFGMILRPVMQLIPELFLFNVYGLCCLLHCGRSL